MINAQDIKIGTAIRMDGKLYFCIDFLHVKPGKGNTFMRTKLKDVVNGYVLERRFNIGEKLEDVRVERRPHQYLYMEGADYFKLLRSMFHSTTLQTLFSTIHPRWSIELGLEWAKHSRLKREGGKEPEYMGEDKEPLVLFTKNYLKDHPDINYFIYGHRHIMLDLMLSRTSRMLILGDWIQDFSYAVFDGENMFLEQYVEGESQYS